MRTTLIAMSIASLFAIAVTSAQAAPIQADDMAQQKNPVMEVNEQKLEQFVTAMNGVQEVSNKYMDEFQRAENAEEAQAIQQKAQQEMLRAVNDSGLSPDEYNAIVQQAQQDDELRARIDELITE